ncbi:AT-hook motif nuclear-localized protein 10 [Dichanthelium oligosanthes]|uniref:AT-hook motif nuclear-localized protein n=1 Tax=Dichanthelium oligosanthes TaxID=888268 RepID=A0A1E5VS04_9POAL|nr:AT-hook motif nuclear-localized protein 10 [Dichanthelium oligosanthes]
MEVGSEQGLMGGRDLFGMPKNPPAPVPAPPASAAMQSVRMVHTADGTPVFAPVTSSAAPPSYQPQGAAHGPSMFAAAVTGANGAMTPPGMGEPVAKKKRGRPRKYGPDGPMALAIVPASAATGSPVIGQGSSGPFSPAGLNPANSLPGVSPEGTKKRGRPKGSTNKPRMDALGSSGVGFTPHVITVQAGEDVSSKIMSFSQHGTRAVCVLSANGAISNVTLRQTATSGGTVTYEMFCHCAM